MEMVEVCAKKMGIPLLEKVPEDQYCYAADRDLGDFDYVYWPYTYREQAMDMIVKFNLCIQPPEYSPKDMREWHVWSVGDQKAARSTCLVDAVCRFVSGNK